MTRPTSLAAVVLAAATLAACGGGADSTGTTSAPTTPSASASASPTASAPASASASAAPAAPGASPLATAKATKLSGAKLADTLKAALKRDGSVKTSITVTGPLAITGKGAEEVGSTKKLKVRATLTGGKDVGIVRSGDTVYLRLPGASTWYKFAADSDDPLAGTYAQSFSGYEVPQDVAATAAVLKKLGTFTVAGQEAVGGVAATKYTVSASAAQASGLLPPAYQPVNPTRLKQGRATVSVWVDAQGRLVRVGSVATIPSTKQIKLLVGYSGWAGPVDVAAPPSGQVGTL